MSLEMGGGISSLDGNENNLEAIEEDYCLNAVHRFRQHWMQHGTFQPAALRHYGVRGDVTLVRSLRQSRSFGATFGTFSLGDFRDFEPPQQQQQQQLEHQLANTPADPTASGAAVQVSSVDRGLNGDYDIPMGAVLAGPNADPRRRLAMGPEKTKAFQDELNRSWLALSQPSEWSQAMCGVLTVANWVTVEQRVRARHQLHLASFMGVKAVQVPLPMLLDGCWQASEADVEWKQDRSQNQPETLSADTYAERNWQLLAEVAESLAAFVRDGDVNHKVWVRCDVCYPLQRRQFHALRGLVLYGAKRDPQTGKVVGVNAVNTNTACEQTRREGIHALMPMLYFSNPYALATFSTEWLGEDVATFEVPPADLLLRAMQPAGNEGSEGGVPGTAGYDRDGRYSAATNARDNSPAGGGGGGGYELLSADHSYSGLLTQTDAEDVDIYSLSNLCDSPTFADIPSGVVRSPADDGLQEGQQRRRQQVKETPNESPLPEVKRRGGDQQQKSNLWQLPADLLPRNTSRWGGHYPARVSLVTFVVELLRRRVAPLFSQFFFDHYTVLNYLHFTAVADHTRDSFVGYEDVLQLPLQPLGHQLSSGVYEVFERDASKYRQYREAFYAYTLDWVNADPKTHHHATRCSTFANRDSPVPPSDEKLTMYVVLLGSGRGPLIDEILSAASSLEVRVRLFAVEKNAPAAALTQLRWQCDPEWHHLSEAFGHTLSTIVGDARTLFDRRKELQLPSDFGLCDVVVSELLGSLADNELSPECIEGFVSQLKQIQAEKAATGLSFNPHMVCIPEAYTAWIAPLHSVHLEQAVADAAIRGLTVKPDGCEDRHAALFHSVFVCNLSRGIALAPPKPCWTFRHSWTSESDATTAPTGAQVKRGESERHLSDSLDRHVALSFDVPPQGRCSGFQGFFSCVLYTPCNPEGGDVVRSPVTVNEGRASGAITMSTAPVFSTRALVDGRTQDMYSWFPCFLPLDPANARDLPVNDNHVAAAVTGNNGVEGQSQSKSAVVTVQLDLSRHVDRAGGKVWYSWRVDYDESLPAPAAHASNPIERRTVVSNENGWASAVLL